MDDDKKAGCGLMLGIALICALVNTMCNSNKSSSPVPDRGGSYTPSYENTEDKLRRVYDSQGIKYDAKMIRDDANAVDQLYREFGK
jgi:hypothetical protein